MRKKNESNSEGNKLVKVLSAHFRALVEAQSDEALLTQYAALLRFLRSPRGDVVRSRTQVPHHDLKPRKPSAKTNYQKLGNASLEELETIINDEKTPRKELEWIAIRRFSVPSGSMRSFSNRQMLVEKLRSLISSERTHDTISSVARGQARLISDY